MILRVATTFTHVHFANSCTLTFPKRISTKVNNIKTPSHLQNVIEQDLSLPVQRKYFEWLTSELNISNLDDWYKVKRSHIQDRNFKIFLNLYNGSLSTALTSIFPEHNWKPWMFFNVPKDYWKDVTNQRAYCDWLMNHLGFKDMEEWYNIKDPDIERNYGYLLRKEYKSVHDLLSTVYPEYDWKIWKFPRVPTSSWTDKKNLREYLDWIAKEEGFQSLEGWYTMTKETLKQKYSLKALQKQPLIRTLIETYPDYNWDLVRMKQIDWNDTKACREFMDNLAQSYGISRPEDWYTFKRRDFVEEGGNGLLSKHKSLCGVLHHVYPENSNFWKPWLFTSCPVHFWDSVENQRAYLEWLGKSLGFSKYEDWYNINRNQIKSAVITKYKSISHMLETIFPEQEWKSWLFTSKHYWNIAENCEQFLSHVEQQLKIAKPEDWYTVKREDFNRLGGDALVAKYGSLYNVLKTFRPNLNLSGWKFVRAASNIWKDPDQIKQFVKDIEKHLHIEKLDDWYRVSVIQIKELGGTWQLYRIGNIPKMLKMVYPEHPWNTALFASTSKKAAQRWLKIKISELFPGKEVEEDYVPPNVHYPTTNDSIELDIYLPEINLALEYQGEHHFRNVNLFGDQFHHLNQDKMKRELCKKQGIHLIEIPYWWDGKIESLHATIHNKFPQMLNPPPTYASPIPTNVPQKEVRQ